MKIDGALYIYFQQSKIFYWVALNCIVYLMLFMVLIFTLMNKIRINGKKTLSCLLVVFLLFAIKNMLNVNSIYAIYNSINIKEDIKYYIVYFDKEEPLVIDKNGQVSLLRNGNLLIEVSKENTKNLPEYLEVTTEYVILKNKSTSPILYDYKYKFIEGVK